MYFPWFNRKTNWCHVPNAFQKGTEAQEPTWIDHVPALQAEEPAGPEARRQGSWRTHWSAEEAEGRFLTGVKLTQNIRFRPTVHAVWWPPP